MLNKFPAKLRIGHKAVYEILWMHGLKNFGECIPNPKQIRLDSNVSESTARNALIHEIIHAINFEYEIELTENQVAALEKAIVSFIRLNKRKLMDLI